MTFAEAIHQFADTQADAVRVGTASFAASNGFRRQAIENLNNETRLLKAAWEKIVIAFLEGLSLNDLHLRFIEVFRQHLLQGPPISLHVPRFGRAITSRRYASIVSDRLGVSEWQAQNFVTRLIASDVRLMNTSEFWTPWRPDRTVWATFDPIDPNSPAFSFASTADDVRGHLGLDPSERSEPILLFEYRLPAHITALFPTVAEAYAGEGWQVFFRPAPPMAAFGLTMTWHEYAAFAPRPETVHLGFNGGTFLTQPRELA